MPNFIPRDGRRRRRWCLLWIALLLGVPGPVVAQGITFGAADDPREQLQRVWWKRESSLFAMGGFSLIGAQWRGAGTLSAHVVTRSITARLSGTLRAGYYGRYEPDVDEPYDLVRLVEFVRYEPPQDVSIHLRAGVLDRLRLGTGHVVNFFNSAVAWDERTVGAEFFWRLPHVEMAAFTDNLLLDGVTGGRLAAFPLFWSASPAARTLELGLNYVTDLADHPPGARRLTAYNADAQFELFRSGSIAFAPFFSYAWYPAYGSGIHFGADLRSDLFIDLLRFRLRLALFYNGEDFIPGFVGSFYPVHNQHARIFDADYYSDDSTDTDLAGVALDEAAGGNGFLSEFHVLVFERFEFWYSFRRHYGSQRLSEMHLRLFLRASDRLRLNVGIDRGGLLGFLTIFGEMDDLSHLVFSTDYRLREPFWLILRARYSYEQIGRSPDPSVQRFVVQRRFEPMLGVRLRF